jgi:membrane-associated phospholipid phosphatase
VGSVNEWLFQQVNELARATPWLHPVAVGYAGYGLVVFAGLLVAGWWSARRAGSARRMAAALSAGAATLVAVAVNQPIVDAVREPRPYMTHPHLLVLAHRTTDFSFPSDHAVMAGAVAAGLWFVTRALAAVATAAAVLMAFSRVYIGAHYPGDVAVGLVLGAVIAVACSLLARRLLTGPLQTAAGTRLGFAVLAQPARPDVGARRGQPNADLAVSGQASRSSREAGGS